MNGIYFLLCGLSLFCNFAHAVEYPDLLEKINSGDVVGVEHCLDSIKNDSEKLKAILAKEDERGRTLLHWAVIKQHLNIVERLLFAGAPIDRKDGVGWTPLYWAIFKKQHTIVKRLIFAGEPIDKTSLSLAAKNQDNDIENLLRITQNKYELYKMDKLIPIDLLERSAVINRFFYDFYKNDASSSFVAIKAPSSTFAAIKDWFYSWWYDELGWDYESPWYDELAINGLKVAYRSFYYSDVVNYTDLLVKRDMVAGIPIKKEIEQQYAMVKMVQSKKLDDINFLFI